MKKRSISVILLVVLLLFSSVPVSAAGTAPEAEAAAWELYTLGLFRGTGTDAAGQPIFELDRAPTRHEAVTMLVRLLGGEAEALRGSWYVPFTDVAEWARPYVGYAYARGLTNGTSAYTYSGEDTVTATQYLTFVLRALGYESGTDFAWDRAWELTNRLGVTDGRYSEFSSFLRGDAALVSRNALSVSLKEGGATLLESILQGAAAASSDPASLTVGGAVYTLGMSLPALMERAGEPDETLFAQGGFLWYVFGTQTETSFLLAGVSDSVVKVLCSAGPSFRYLGYAAGSTALPAGDSRAVCLTDKNDRSILHGVVLADSSVRWEEDFSPLALYGEARVCFHLTNAFRRYHGLAALQWSDAAAEAARLHSQDMADQNYFEHDSLDGRTPWQRMGALGVTYSSAAENIQAGYGGLLFGGGIGAYNGWVNSAGHRKNLLGNYVYMGAGCGYNPASVYHFYATQDFYTP